MPRTTYDPNPHISVLDDAATKKQIAAQVDRVLDLNSRLRGLPISDDELAAVRFQIASNAMAEANPLYAAARSAANFLVVPLEDSTPYVKLSDATRDPRQLFAWWSKWPDANPGVLLGRAGGLIALRVADKAAGKRLREMLAVDRRDPDTDRTWTEYRELGGGTVRLLAPSQPFSIRTRVGWGRAFDQAAEELRREARRADLRLSPPTHVDALSELRGPQTGSGLAMTSEAASLRLSPRPRS